MAAHGELKKCGYTGSYDRVAAFSRGWRRQQQEASKVSRNAFVPLVFAPGEAFQFDWSEDWVVIGAERTKLMVAQFKLCHSRAFMLRAYLLQSHEMLFDAHNHCLAALGGVGRRPPAGHLRQHEDGGGPSGPREGAGGQRPVQGDGEPFSVRSAVLHAWRRMGERPGREERAGRAAAAIP